MNKIKQSDNSIYNGPEAGPIRPPSEASSLMLRVTRNCPWNKCKFCTLYKGTDFSIRRREHVIKDIDSFADDPSTEHYYGTITSVFLQDANTLLAKTDDLLAILKHLRKRFPKVNRITSYARSATVNAKSDEELIALKEAGLDRIHIGFESGSDKVLELVKKGATKQIHIDAGLKVKRAGIELSEYYILGLGGKELSEDHAAESADALSRIEPDFIRIRTLSIPKRAPLYEDVAAGRFTVTNDDDNAEELLSLISGLDTHSKFVTNDHIVNLLPEATGVLPDEKDKIVNAVKWYIELSAQERMIYRIGRRAGQINSRREFEDARLHDWAESLLIKNHVDENNIDEFIAKAMRRFI